MKVTGPSMVIMILVVVVVVQSAEGRLVKVGPKGLWTPGYNFSEWSSHEHFYVGDWIIFNFDKNQFNVLEVNKTSFESCNDQGFIKNITRGGRDVVQLTEQRTYYYLSSGGYCWNGMKVAINVELPPAPAPAPSKNGSPSSHFASHMNTLVMFFAALWIPRLIY